MKMTALFSQVFKVYTRTFQESLSVTDIALHLIFLVSLVPL